MSIESESDDYESPGGTMTTGLNLDWLISADDHVLEPPHLWIDRVPATDRAGFVASRCFHGLEGRSQT